MECEISRKINGHKILVFVLLLILFLCNCKPSSYNHDPLLSIHNSDTVYIYDIKIDSLCKVDLSIKPIKQFVYCQSIDSNLFLELIKYFDSSNTLIMTEKTLNEQTVDVIFFDKKKVDQNSNLNKKIGAKIGRGLFLYHCSSCHGVFPELEILSINKLWSSNKKLVILHKDIIEKTSFKELNDDEINAIKTYFKRLMD